MTTSRSDVGRLRSVAARMSRQRTGRSNVDHLLSLCSGQAQRTTSKAAHDLAGYGTMLAAMKFMQWAIEQDRFPTPESVMARFNVCRATAYRWTLALADTYGIAPEVRHTFDRPRQIHSRRDT